MTSVLDAAYHELALANSRLRVALEMSELARDRALAEVGRLRALSQNNAHSWDAIVKVRNELRAEVEQLKAALTEYAKGDNWLRDARFDPNSHRFDGISFAMAALEFEP